MCKLFIVLFVVTAILGGFHRESYAASNVIDEAKQVIETNSITGGTDSSSNNSSVQDMVKSLSDPYAEYIPKEQYKNYMDNLNGRYVGIGAYISFVPEGVSILSVMDDSPALAAGLKEGDIITIADGKILSGLPLGIASSYIKGEEGTVAKLHIKRGWHFFNCDVIRKRVAVSTVDSNILDGHIGYIKITSFTESTLNDFKKKLKRVKSENPDNYIIDLRDNGGGLLASAIGVAGSFVEGLKPVVIVKDRNNTQVEHLSFGSVEIIDKPLIFLVNKNTASAAEVLTAAVRDYKKALIIGTNTYGKGTVQGIYPLSDGSAVKMTIQSFYSPQGSPID